MKTVYQISRTWRDVSLSDLDVEGAEVVSIVRINSRVRMVSRGCGAARRRFSIGFVYLGRSRSLTDYKSVAR